MYVRNFEKPLSKYLFKDMYYHKWNDIKTTEKYDEIKTE